MRLFIAIFSAFLIFSMPWAAHAAERQQGPLVKVRILPEKSEIKAGEEIWIGIEQSIAPHWHTYWANPGDSGVAPSVSWDLPDGFEVSELYWPTPEKMPYGDLLNYGYEGTVMLLQKLSAPRKLSGGPIELNASVELLVCQDECIPEYSEHRVVLNDVAMGGEDNSAYLERARKALPKPAGWDVVFTEETAGKHSDFVLKLRMSGDLRHGVNLTTVEFFPLEWGVLDNAAPTQTFFRDGAVHLKQRRGERPLHEVEELPGVVVFETLDGKRQSYAVNAGLEGVFSLQRPSAASFTALVQAVVLALLGGVILNLMPCVFPVLSMKALSLVKIAEKQPSLAHAHGLSYTAGVIVSFLVIAGILIALQAGGAQIGWGFQLQNPVVVGILGYLLFAVGLNFIGFFEVTSSFTNIGGRFTRGHGLSGSFATGVLATLVATPCTAPFMATAIGFALVQPPIVSLIIFAALGLGLALPYLLLSFIPSLQHVLPKPGAWMDVFKQFLAFPMFGAALWLLWVLAQQTGVMGMTAALIGAVLITFSIWMFKHIASGPFWHYMTRALAVLSLLLALAILPGEMPNQMSDDMNAQRKNTENAAGFGEVFSESALEKALAGDGPVFTEMTASWCITCKVNHAVAINTDSTRRLFAQYDVQYFVGDWTNKDPEITKYLQRYGRSGVPLYVYYGRRDPVTNLRPEPKLLPQILTPGVIEKALRGAL